MALGGIENLDYTVLRCSDMDSTCAFYRDAMLFPVEHERPNWVSFRVGSSILALRPSELPEPKSEVAAVQLAFRVAPPAIDVCHAALVARGVPIDRGPVDLPSWRHRAIFLRDPEHNVIDIYAEY